MATKTALGASTIFVTNLPFNIGNDEFQQFFVKHGPIQSCFVVFDSGHKSKGYGFVSFMNRSDARSLVASKESIVMNGRKLGIQFATKKTTDVSERRNAAIQAPRCPRPTIKQHRLIVRNLSFEVTENDLRTAFEKFGKVTEISMPKKDGGAPGGFAFVQFLHKSPAAKAVAALNGCDILGRSIAVDFTLSKRDYEISKSTPLDTPNTLDETPLSSRNTGQGLGSEDSGFYSDRDDDDISELSDDDSYLPKQELSSSRPIQQHKGNLKRLGRHQENNGRTLFVKNLLFETTEDDLRGKFDKFGKLDYVVFVKDKLGRSKGSAFVCFNSNEGYEACFEDYLSSKSKISDHIKCGRELSDAANRSMLTELAPYWVLHGRWMDCCACIDKALAKEKADEGLSAKRAADKRNLYLLRESYVNPNSEYAAQFSKEELIKRVKSQTQRMQQIKNPQYFVSKTRLIVHNLPLSMDEKSLKAFALKSVEEFFLKTSTEEPAINTVKSKQPYIKQCKIMRNEDRKTAEGVARSLGYGFIEFSEFGHALAFLRAVNSIPPNQKVKRLAFAEFALENSTVVNMRLSRQKRPPSDSSMDTSANKRHRQLINK